VGQPPNCCLGSRAVPRGGTGHNYWKRFDEEAQTRIEELGREIFRLLFEPRLVLPVKTLDVPVAGQGYSPHVLPFVFGLVNLANRVAAADSTRKCIQNDLFSEDAHGSATIRYITSVRAVIWRVCSNHLPSLGLHPAFYFYTPSGGFQPTALLNFLALFRDWDTAEFVAFTKVRAQFEEFLLSHRGITEAVRKLGSGARSRPRVISFYKPIIADFEAGKSAREVTEELAKVQEYAFLVAEPFDYGAEAAAGRFSRDTKGGAFLRDALPTAPRCPKCRGIMHRNAMQAGHQKARRDGGAGALSNAQMEHPFCNSTVDN
jgi:hypothetical protein